MTKTTSADIKKASAILREGGLVAFPTETVYGLGGDARNVLAVKNIFDIKSRPYNHPLIIHFANLSQLDEWVLDLPRRALQLAKAFWPGPLTLILKKAPGVIPEVTGGQTTIGVRVPSHPVAQALLTEFASGIAAPSANRFTRISATTTEAVFEELGERVNLILEGGRCDVGVESTILDMSEESPTFLRPGAITKSMIESVLGEKISMSSPAGTTVRTSGMHALHYAPTTETVMLTRDRLLDYVDGLEVKAEAPIALMTRSLLRSSLSALHCQIAMPQDAPTYARLLYQTMRELDRRGFKKIVI